MQLSVWPACVSADKQSTGGKWSWSEHGSVLLCRVEVEQLMAHAA